MAGSIPSTSIDTAHVFKERETPRIANVWTRAASRTNHLFSNHDQVELSPEALAKTSDQQAQEGNHQADQVDSTNSSDPVSQSAEIQATGHTQAPSLEWDGGELPELSINVSPDAIIGWNVLIDVTNFRFAPENASGPHNPGEGHAHLLVDGNKIARVYGPAFHIPSLPPGEHEIAISLNANNHTDFSVEGDPILSSFNVTVPE